MLFNLDDLKGMKLQALDGEIGKCVDFLFDDEHWTIRYMDARAGSWLMGKRVLISPISLRSPDWSGGHLPVRLRREQVRESPSLAEDQPVSRQFEAEFFRYYNYGNYWIGNAVWGAGVLPGELENLYMEQTQHEEQDNHLRSLKEVTGYKVLCGDEKQGHLDGVLVDADSWLIRYLIVDTGQWLAHERVVIPPRWTSDISWSGHSLSLCVGRQQVEAAPRYTATAPVSAADEQRFRQHFDQSKH